MSTLNNNEVSVTAKLTTLKAINKLIDKIKVDGELLDLQIQQAAVSCLAHISKHGDTTVLDRLIDAMPQGSRKKVLVDWCVNYGEVRTLVRGDAADEARIEKGHIFALDKGEGKAFNEVEAWANKWFNFKPQPDVLSTFDADKGISSLAKRYQRALKTGAVVDVTAQGVQELRALLQSLEALTTDGV